MICVIVAIQYCKVNRRLQYSQVQVHFTACQFQQSCFTMALAFYDTGTDYIKEEYIVIDCNMTSNATHPMDFNLYTIEEPLHWPSAVMLTVSKFLFSIILDLITVYVLKISLNESGQVVPDDGENASVRKYSD